MSERPMQHVEHLYAQALEAQRTGRGRAAETAYRALLELQPDHDDALHNLGLIAMQTGRPLDGIGLLRQAFERNPNKLHFWTNYGKALIAVGELELAEDLERAGKRAGIRHAEWEQFLALVSQERKLRKGLVGRRATLPDLAQARRAIASGDRDRLEAAWSTVSQSGVLHPKLTWLEGMVWLQRGHPQRALPILRRATALLSEDWEAWAGLGNCVVALGHRALGAQIYSSAIRLNPDHEGLRADVVNLYVDSDQPERALAAAAETPGGLNAISSPRLLGAIGRALKLIQRGDEALDVFDRAVKLAPDDVRLLAERADCFEGGGLYDEALADWRKVAGLNDPAFREAGVRAAVLLAHLGQPDRAWREVIEHSSKLDRNAQEKYLKSALFTINYAIEPTSAEIIDLYRNYERRFMQVATLPPRPISVDGESRRLRVGYVSGDFRRHSAAFFALPLFEHFDRDRFEVFAYSTLDPKLEDEWTERFTQCVDHFIRVANVDDDALAQRVASERIDILVDLAGHTVGGRLGVFARRPAPVSVSWLGYGYTTGLSTIDWFLGDEYVVPKGSEPYFAECPWRLERPFLVYRPEEGVMGECGPLPAWSGHGVVLGTLSRTIRINDRVLSVWAEILRRVPGAKLHIDNKHVRHPSARKLFLERCLAQGIAEDRLILEYHSPPWDVLRSFDLTLDCFPHNSGTTLFESAFMGVPFVTLADRPSVGRIGSSVAHGLGHPEWVAQTEAEYVEKAVAMVADLDRLAALRAGLRERMKASPLMDEAGFARSVEEAYLGMCEAARVKAAS